MNVSAKSTTISAGDENIIVRTNITYATHDGVELRGDLYLPGEGGNLPGEGGSPFPVVIAAPGGGWRVCDPRAAKNWGPYFARHGIALFGFQYRVADGIKMFPEAVCDVISAIQFVRGAASELDIDPGRIALLGSSAGAHVASLAALAGDTPLFKSSKPCNGYEAIDFSVRALAGIYGVYDLFALWQHEIANITDVNERRSECLIGAPPYADQQRYFEASPISYVRYAANKLPVFLCYGTADDIVNPEQQSEKFLRLLKQAGFRVHGHPIIGAGHFWFSEEPVDEPGSYSSFLAPRLLRFVKQYL
ncbi:alpha/beta fold hydrolase [Rhizobium puerariae]|uniref:Alpha/beta fold hydrolase n=1 Tax=Rhizobium puerariae TaxID=1585791 RepID=A0ABV6AQS5_9HYPH